MRRLLKITIAVLLVFASACGILGDKPGNTGTVEVVAQTHGENQDNSYKVTVIDRQKNISADGRVVFEDVETGNREVTLTDVADNCYVDGNNTKSVELSTESPGIVGYTINCE